MIESEQEKQGDYFVNSHCVCSERLENMSSTLTLVCGGLTVLREHYNHRRSSLSCCQGPTRLHARELIHKLILQPQGQEVGVGPEFVGLLQIFRGFSPLLD